jgi:hypothetical protein
MFWKKKPNAGPHGVPLEDLMVILAQTTIKASLKGNVLIATHENYAVRIDVVPPDKSLITEDSIQAVVRVTTELPTAVMSMFRGKQEQTMSAFNAFAALGALYQEGATVRIGSRLTIYEEEDAWRTLHLPLLAYTVICGSEAILGGIRRALTNEGLRNGASEWTAHDLAYVERHMSEVCFCNADDLTLTAEFGLAEGAYSAAAGDRRTALFQMMADQPHPELGGGLFCLLQMPHRVADQAKLQRICQQLNQMEMAGQDLPPHFGAWCPGKMGNNFAYVSFLPNALHSVPGVAVNQAIWALNRASWANGKLASIGVKV